MKLSEKILHLFFQQILMRRDNKPSEFIHKVGCKAGESQQSPCCSSICPTLRLRPGSSVGAHFPSTFPQLAHPLSGLHSPALSVKLALPSHLRLQPHCSSTFIYTLPDLFFLLTTHHYLTNYIYLFISLTGVSSTQIRIP